MVPPTDSLPALPGRPIRHLSTGHTPYPVPALAVPYTMCHTPSQYRTRQRSTIHYVPYTIAVPHTLARYHSLCAIHVLSTAHAVGQYRTPRSVSTAPHAISVPHTPHTQYSIRSAAGSSTSRLIKPMLVFLGQVRSWNEEERNQTKQQQEQPPLVQRHFPSSSRLAQSGDTSWMLLLLLLLPQS